MESYEMKAKEFLLHPKTVLALVTAILVAYGWMFTTFVSASDFNRHVQTYELDRTDDKIDDLEVQIFNLKELIAQDSTPERRRQLSKYEGSKQDYKRQQECLEEERTNCRRDR